MEVNILRGGEIYHFSGGKFRALRGPSRLAEGCRLRGRRKPWLHLRPMSCRADVDRNHQALSGSPASREAPAPAGSLAPCHGK